MVSAAASTTDASKPFSRLLSVAIARAAVRASLILRGSNPFDGSDGFRAMVRTYSRSAGFTYSGSFVASVVCQAFTIDKPPRAS